MLRNPKRKREYNRTIPPFLRSFFPGEPSLRGSAGTYVYYSYWGTHRKFVLRTLRCSTRYRPSFFILLLLPSTGWTQCKCRVNDNRQRSTRNTIPLFINQNHYFYYYLFTLFFFFFLCCCHSDLLIIFKK